MGSRAEPDVDIPAGDVKKGAKLFKAKCFQCHTIEQGGNCKQGPPLFGIFGKVSGTNEGFSYSEANKSSGITWSEKHMFQYLVDPKKYIPGTKMVFAGMNKEIEEHTSEPQSHHDLVCRLLLETKKKKKRDT